MVHAEERKEQIMNAAIELIAEHGYERTSIAMICERLGIGRGTLYQYFDDKKSLFREIIQSYMGRLKPLARELTLENADSMTTEEASFQGHLLITRELYRNRHLFRILTREAPAKNTEVGDLLDQIKSEFVEIVRANLEAMDRRGLMHIDDPEFTAVYFMGGIMEAADRYLFVEDGSLSPEILARKIAHLQTMLARAR